MSTTTVKQMLGRKLKYNFFTEFWQITPKPTLIGKQLGIVKFSATKGTSNSSPKSGLMSLSLDPDLSGSTYFSSSSKLRGFMG